MAQVIGIIGTGRMGSALARGLVAAGTPAGDVVLSDADQGAASGVAAELGVSAAPGNQELAAKSGVIIIAVKPGVVSAVLGDISMEVDDSKLIVSIAAGITTTAVEKSLSGCGRVVRVMPNTPLQIGKGASAYCLGKKATRDDANLVGEIFSRFGIAVEVGEELMDVVTGLSGSGPAFVYLMIEALVNGAVKMGLSREIALKLAAQTALGAAAMVLETGRDPEDLCNEVTSPGGTTLAGLKVLEEKQWAASAADAVIAAAKRSGELGRDAGKS